MIIILLIPIIHDKDKKFALKLIAAMDNISDYIIIKVNCSRVSQCIKL